MTNMQDKEEKARRLFLEFEEAIRVILRAPEDAQYLRGRDALQEAINNIDSEQDMDELIEALQHTVDYWKGMDTYQRHLQELSGPTT